MNLLVLNLTPLVAWPKARSSQLRPACMLPSYEGLGCCRFECHSLLHMTDLYEFTIQYTHIHEALRIKLQISIDIPEVIPIHP